MQADDIPTEITEAAAAAIHFTYGQEDAGRSRRIAVAVLVATWPAIEAHILRQAADVSERVGRRVYGDAPLERRAEGAWEIAAELRRMATEAENPQF